MVRICRVLLMSVALLTAQYAAAWPVAALHGGHETGGNRASPVPGVRHAAPSHDDSDVAGHCPLSVCSPSLDVLKSAGAIVVAGTRLVTGTFADDRHRRTPSLATDPPVPKRRG